MGGVTTDGGEEFAQLAASLEANAELAAVHDVSGRRLLGDLVSSLKRALRRLLTAVLARQNSYNHANLRLVAALDRRLDVLVDREGRPRIEVEPLGGLVHGLQARVAALEDPLARTRTEAATAAEASGERVAALESGLAPVREEQRAVAEELRAAAAARDAVAARLAALERAADAAASRAAGLERRLRRVVHLVGGEPAAPIRPVSAPPGEPLEPVFDALAFKDAFRGSESEVRDRQRDYVGHFEGRADVLDIGCGRGDEMWSSRRFKRRRPAAPRPARRS